MRLSPIALIAILAGCAAPRPQAPAAPLRSPTALELSIGQSQQYLLSYEATHFLHPPPDQNNQADVRREALVAFSLLSSGVRTNDPILVPLLAFIANVKNPDPYVRGLRLRILGLLWSQTHDPAVENLALADAATLVKSIHVGDPLAGLWSAADDPAWPAAEASNRKEITADFYATESALAGLSAAARMGANIPNGLWLLAQRQLRHDQYPDGAWSDINPPAPTGMVYPAITLANLHSLQIIRAYLTDIRSLICDGSVTDDSIDNALIWVGKHFDQFHTASEYWAIEQIAAMSGYRYFDRTDWFAAIAPRITNLAGPGEHNEINPVVTESLHLLFLSCGSAPVTMTKLDYSAVQGHGMNGGNWNERPMDALNLTRWAGDQEKATLNWQIATLDTPSDDLHDSPILYLAGDQIIRLSHTDIAELRQFVIEGGMILGNADCNSAAFRISFTRLGQKMFPRYEFRALGRSDLIFTGESYKKFRGQAHVLGLSNGVRELMLLLPTDAAGAWEANAVNANLGAFELGADIFQYATDSVLRPRNESYIVRPDPAIKPTRTIRVARLMVGDNPDPEPGGWPRLAAILHNDYRIDLQVSAVKAGESLAGFQVVHLTGTTAFHFTPAERKALIEFTRHGGTLIIDAAGGSGEFAASAKSELEAMFGNGAGYQLTWLAPGSLLYTLPQALIGQVEYRRFARRLMTGDATTPRILGVESGGRCVAFFSPFDLSAGLVGEMVDGVNGYSPDSATALMRNMILYAASASK